jgi:putative tryptophan/tyrosine transport system substrate-binding protein
MIDRRVLLALLGGALAATPFAAVSKSTPHVKRVAVLMASAEGDPEGAERVAALRAGLAKPVGTSASQVQIDVWWHAGVADRAQTMAKDIVERAPDLIVVNGTIGLAALKALTSTIPIIFVVVTDPVGSGFVQSFARPGGNITGFSTFEPEIAGKWVQTLKEAAPAIRRIGLLIDPEAKGLRGLIPAAEAAATAHALKFEWLHARTREEIEHALGTFMEKGGAAKRDAGLVIMPAAVNSANRDLIYAMAERHRLPAIYPFVFQARGGGLLAYGFDTVDQFRRAADYVGRIIAGQSPAELPVQAPVKFNLVLNLKAAKAIGLTFPTALLLGANEVIE